MWINPLPQQLRIYRNIYCLGKALRNCWQQPSVRPQENFGPIIHSAVAWSRTDNTATACDRPLRRCVNLPRRRLLRSALMGLLQLRFEHDSSTIRARFEHDTSTTRARHATTRYEVFRALAYEIDSSTPRESVVGVSCMLIDSSMHTTFTYTCIGLPYIVCVNMPEIVYTNAIKCQYAEYTIIHREIIVMLKWKTCGHILRAFIA